jgi:hypothetical protein
MLQVAETQLSVALLQLRPVQEQKVSTAAATAVHLEAAMRRAQVIQTMDKEVQVEAPQVLDMPLMMLLIPVKEELEDLFQHLICMELMQIIQLLQHQVKDITGAEAVRVTGIFMALVQVEPAAPALAAALIQQQMD